MSTDSVTANEKNVKSELMCSRCNEEAVFCRCGNAGPEIVEYTNPVKQVGRAMFEHCITLDHDLSDRAFRVYALLVMYAQQKSWANPSQERLAQDLGRSVCYVKRAMAELVRAGLIKRKRRFHRDGPISSMTYLQDIEPKYHEKAMIILEEREQKRKERERKAMPHIKNDL